MDSNEAAAALAGVSGAQHRLADQIGDCPPWRHAAFGFVMALLVGGASLPPLLQSTTVVVGMALVALIVRYDRRRYGVFINGYRRGKTRIVAFGILAVVLGLYAVSVVRGLDHHDHIAPLLLGAVAMVVAILGSMLWQRVFVREMGV